MNDRELLAEAKKARLQAYTPYSHFKVGAALLTKDGKLYRGCNIENASYTPTNCAERTAFFKAVSEGERAFSKIAIAGGAESENGDEFCAPCGVCRQVMLEFCDPEEFEIILSDGPDAYKVMKLKEMMPYGFAPERLTKYEGEEK